MKKGFTLIELLAVIVILAIIAIIAVPIVVTLINDSAESSTLRSAEFYINAVENAIMEKNLDGGKFNPKECRLDKDTGDLNCDGTLIKIESEGERPIDAVILYENGKIVDVYLEYPEDVKIVESIEGGLTYSERNQICKPVTNDTKTTGNVPKGKYEKGDEYICEVKPGVKYHFFILSTSGEKVNLILDRNINSDGTLATSSIGATGAVNEVYSKTAWISQSDYLDANTDGTSCGCTSCNDEGPLTAMKYLDKATSDWKYIINLNETYKDEDGMYGTIEFNEKARLPKASELSSAGCADGGATCPKWLINYLGTSTHTSGLGLSHTTMNGYWVLSSSKKPAANKCNGSETKYVFKDGNLGSGTEAFQTFYGVRPVISLYKANLEA